MSSELEDVFNSMLVGKVIQLLLVVYVLNKSKSRSIDHKLFIKYFDQRKSGVIVCQINTLKGQFAGILKRHCCYGNKLVKYGNILKIDLAFCWNILWFTFSVQISTTKISGNCYLPPYIVSRRTHLLVVHQPRTQVQNGWVSAACTRVSGPHALTYII